MIRSTQVNTDLVAMFNRTLHSISKTNSMMTLLTDIRPCQENISYRNEALHRLMYYRSHQAEY